MEIKKTISTLPNTPLFSQVKAYLSERLRKRCEIKFKEKETGLGYIGMTGSVTVAKITPDGVAEKWSSFFSNDDELRIEKDVEIPGDVCFVEIYYVCGQSWVILHVNPSHEKLLTSQPARRR